MTRMSKQGKRRHLNPKKRQPAKVLIQKTGPKSDAVAFKEHTNALTGSENLGMFIPKIK